MAGQALQEAPGDDAKNGEKPLKKQLPPGAVLRAVLQQWRREMNTRRDWSFLKSSHASRSLRCLPQTIYSAGTLCGLRQAVL